MIEERFTIEERRLLMRLAMDAMPQDRSDSQLITILSKLSGTDTVLVAQRAYPSIRSRGLWQEQSE